MVLDEIDQNVERFRREGNCLTLVRQKTFSRIEVERPELVSDTTEIHLTLQNPLSIQTLL